MEKETEECSTSSEYPVNTSSSDGQAMAVGRVTRNSVSVKCEEGRYKRRKPQPRPGESWCPVCGVTVRPGDMEAHLTQELDKLARIPQSRPLYQRPPTPTSTPTTSGIQAVADAAASSSSSSSSSSGALEDGRGRWRSARKRRRCPGWETYQRVKAGRQVRTRAKRLRVTYDETDEEWRVCPVCDIRVDVDSMDELGRHIMQCLRKAEEEYEDEDVDIEGDYEEYEWCGQTRVRATQMLRAEGQLHALGTKVQRGSEDEMVDVCEDGEDEFGPPQYNDEDLGGGGGGGDGGGGGGREDEGEEGEDVKVDDEEDVKVEDDEDDDVQIDDEDNDDLGRRPQEANCESLSLPVESSSNTLSAWSAPAQSGDHPESQREDNDNNSVANDRKNSVANDISTNSAVVEALRARVMELEEERKSYRCSCRVCHGQYEKPLVSVSCWHVHCEQCWLQALAAKKLCPQCSTITSPSDLRRVYL